MRITTTVAVTVAATAALAVAAPASAEVQNRTDPRGDTTSLGTIDRFSAESSADIVRLRGEYAGDTLSFTLTLADLTPEQAGVTYGARFATPGGRDYYAVVSREGGEKVVGLTETGENGGERQCEGLQGRLLSAKDQVVISVPRSCVRNPRSVRFGGGTVTEGLDGRWTDDARRVGDPGATADIKLGTRQLARN